MPIYLYTLISLNWGVPGILWETPTASLNFFDCIPKWEIRQKDRKSWVLSADMPTSAHRRVLETCCLRLSNRYFNELCLLFSNETSYVCLPKLGNELLKKYYDKNCFKLFWSVTSAVFILKIAICLIKIFSAESIESI